MSREEEFVERISGYLNNSKTAIDVGAGRGVITSLLRQQGKKVTPVDVIDYRWGRQISDVLIYNGVKLPFSGRKFDTGLLITVLHHTPNPEIVFSEVARVSREMVVMETTYRNFADKLITVLLDTLGNLRFKFFWNSYKTVSEWENFFAKYGFRVVSSKVYDDRVLGFSFLHVVFYLKKE